VQNIYIRRRKRAGKLVNVDIGVEEMVKDPEDRQPAEVTQRDCRSRARMLYIRFSP
jgi:hypothetical protein